MKCPCPVVPLGELLAPLSRPEPVKPDETYRILGAHWYAGGLYIKETTSGAGVRASTLYRVEEGDFVYNRLFAWKGSFAAATKESAGCYVSNEFPCFRADADRLDTTFLWRYFSRSSAWDEALALSTGGTPTSRNRLKEDKFLSLKIPLPPLNEQRRIVARIEALAAKIQEAHQLRYVSSESAGVLIDSALREIFERGKASGWQRLTLDSLCTFGPQNGLFKTRDCFGQGTPLLNVADAYKSLVVRREGLERVLARDDEIERYRLEPGDVCMVRSSIKDEGIGRACVFLEASEPVVFECHLMRLRLDPRRIEPQLFVRFFNSSIGKEQVLSNRRAAVMTTINQRDVAALTFPVPPLAEQRSIVAYLDSLEAKVDALKHLQAETAAELDALLPSILDQAFKGEL
jgi:type I restriction enzyme S subunit